MSVKQVVKKCLTVGLQHLYFTLASQVSPTLPSTGLMVIAPHPDDETLGCGALIARARDKNIPVYLIFVTDGGASPTLQPMTRESLTSLRRREAGLAAQHLGVPAESTVFLGHEDGKLQSNFSTLAQDIANQIWLHNPGVILSPFGHDMNKDHRAIATVIDRLFKEKKITASVLEYPIWYWPRQAFYDLFGSKTRSSIRKISTQGYLGQKKEAIHSYRSQFGSLSGQEGTGHLPKGFAQQHLRPYELFFEKTV